MTTVYLVYNEQQDKYLITGQPDKVHQVFYRNENATDEDFRADAVDGFKRFVEMRKIVNGTNEFKIITSEIV